MPTEPAMKPDRLPWLVLVVLAAVALPALAVGQCWQLHLRGLGSLCWNRHDARHVREKPYGLQLRDRQLRLPLPSRPADSLPGRLLGRRVWVMRGLHDSLWVREASGNLRGKLVFQLECGEEGQLPDSLAGFLTGRVLELSLQQLPVGLRARRAYRSYRLRLQRQLPRARTPWQAARAHLWAARRLGANAPVLFRPSSESWPKPVPAVSHNAGTAEVPAMAGLLDPASLSTDSSTLAWMQAHRHLPRWVLDLSAGSSPLPLRLWCATLLPQPIGLEWKAAPNDTALVEWPPIDPTALTFEGSGVRQTWGEALPDVPRFDGTLWVRIGPQTAQHTEWLAALLALRPNTWLVGLPSANDALLWENHWLVPGSWALQLPVAQAWVGQRPLVSPATGLIPQLTVPPEKWAQWLQLNARP